MHSHSTSRLALLALTLIAACELPPGPACAVGWSNPADPRTEVPPPSLTVTGFGAVPAVQDTATIQIGTQTRDADPGAAMAGSNAKIGRVTAALAELGVEASDIQVAGVAMVRPQPLGSPGATCQTDDQCAMDEICDNGQCMFSGVAPRPEQPHGDDRALVVVDQQIVVTLRDPDKLGELLARAVTAGADSIQSVAFAVGDPNALTSQAREIAIADARARA